MAWPPTPTIRGQKNLTTIEVEVSKFASKPVIGNEEKTRDVFRAVDYYPITCLEVMFLFGYFFAKSFRGRSTH